MKEPFLDEEEELINNNDDNNIINAKINIDTYNSSNNIISTNFEDDNLLINNEIQLPNSNSSNYISPSPINKIMDYEDLNIQASKESRLSILENFNEELNTVIKFNIREASLIPINIINDKSLSPDCYSGVENAPSPLLSEFMKVDTDLVLTPLLNERKKFFRKLSISDIMSWQKKELKISLLIMPKEDDNLIAIQMFRNLLSYMLDRKSSKRPVQHVIKFIKLIKFGSPRLKDEAYLQVYKQLHKNKKYESLMRGWKFLAILASTFAPDNNDIYNLILKFLFFEYKENPDNLIKNHANYTFVRMVKTKNRERKMPPFSEEIEYIENLRPMQIPIYYFNGKHIMVKIESYTTFKEIKSIIMDKLDFSNQRAIYYSIYEICYKTSGTEERYLDDNEIIADVLSMWNSDIKKSKNNKEDIMFRLYLRLLIYYPYDDSMIDNMAIEYYQTVYDVISGKFSLSEEEILILGALQLVNEFGNNIEKAYINITQNYQNYIPWEYMHIMSNEQWIEKIMEFYSYFMNYSQIDCKKEYIKLLEDKSTFKTPLFGSKFSEKKSNDNNDEFNPDSDIILGFKPEGIVIFNQQKEIIAFYEYIYIQYWGISANYLVINIKKGNSANRKLYFHVSETNVIQTIMTIYVNFLAGKSLKEITQDIEQRDKSFDNNRPNKRIGTKYIKQIDDEINENDKNYKKFFIFPNSSGNN